MTLNVLTIIHQYIDYKSGNSFQIQVTMPDDNHIIIKKLANNAKLLEEVTLPLKVLWKFDDTVCHRMEKLIKENVLM